MDYITASDFSRYLIFKSSLDGKPVTNLKLQKLLYYAQGWYLAFYRKQLFADRIEAWVHGPVVPEVFREYRDFRWSPLPALEATVSAEIADHADQVLSSYGNFDAFQLERMTHSESPWLEARLGLPADRAANVEIKPEAMTRYFRSLVNG